MIEADHPRLSIGRQCALVSISRSAFYYRPAGETPLNLELMRLIDETFLEMPWYGSRQMARHLRRRGYGVGRMRCGGRWPRRRAYADLSEAAHDDPAPRAPGLQVSAARPDHRPAQPGLVLGHHLYPDAARLPVPGGGDGLGDPQGAVLAAVQQHGRGVLHPGPGGGPGPLRAAGDLQHRPGQPVYLAPLRRRPAGSPGCGCPWTRRAPRGWTTCSSNASGAASNTSASTSTPSRPDRAAGGSSTRWIGYYNTDLALTRPLPGPLPTRPMGKSRAVALSGGSPRIGLNPSANLWRREMNPEPTLARPPNCPDNRRPPHPL